MKVRLSVLTFVSLLLLFPFQVQAASTYKLNDLGTPPNLTTSYAESINNKGQIVGHTNSYGTSPNNAFVYHNGTFQLLPMLTGGIQAEAFDINDAGQIAGFSDGLIDGTSQLGAVIWDHGKVIYLGNLGMGGEARALNNRGQVVGYSYNARSSTADLLPFIWDKGVMTPLPTLGGRNNFAYDINEAGVVVGAVETPQGLEAVYWQNGILHDLGIRGFAYGINNKNQIVGSMNVEFVSDSRAFLWENGVITDLGTLDNIRSEAWKINDSGQIVGSSNYLPGTSNQSTYHAFIWQDGVMTDLGSISGSSFGRAINSKGDAVGYSEYAPSSYHPVWWSPHN